MDTTAREETSHDEHPGGGPLLWSLSVVHHRDPDLLGQRVVIEAGSSLLLGRHEPCFGPGALEDARISRSHARITVDAAGAASIEDLESRNGTRLNGAPLARGPLAEGDVVGLGSILLLAHRAPAVYRVYRDPVLVGVSHGVSRVLSEIERVAPRPAHVLVLGETGTGKELVARALHRASGRRGPLCTMNCGALPDTVLYSELFGHTRGAFSGADADREGLAEAARDGTLFLDEIGDASPAFQLALLRFLESGEVRRLGTNRVVKVATRVVAATHRDLFALAASGAFREDLLARLARWVIHIPPLRARAEDIPLLAARALAEAGDARPIHHRLALALLRHDWPRNVRELSALVQRAAVESEGSPTVDLVPSVAAQLPAPSAAPTSLPPPPAAPPPPPERTGPPTADDLRALLERHHGNVTAAAAELGVGRNTLYRWLKGAALDPVALR